MRNIIILLLACLPGIPRLYGQVKQVSVNVDAAVTYQTIRSFGASDAWACQFAGAWPADKKNAIADLLFSMDTTAGGQPQGIGLSLWRFNVGAGSAQQGDNSGIGDEWRRAESFLEPDHTYNWNRQAGQQWFLQAARERGVSQFLAFLNSPPVQLTRNGKAFATKGNCNIDSSRYQDLATYVAQVIKGVQAHTGILFGYLSPVNEPQWDWSDGGQEGCPYSNAQVSGLVKAISQTFTAQRLPTKILVPEAGQLNYLYETANKPARGAQVSAFFDPASSAYLGQLPAVEHSIAGHSYFTSSPYDTAVQVRQRLAAQVAGVKGLEYWQSEYCILGDNAGEINGSGRDLGMDAALYLARVIHQDLTIANAAAWHHWLAVSPYDYKDGLVYIDKQKTDGQYYESKMLWVLGNYSRFIRPGARRVQATLGDSTLAPTLLVSAYRNADHTFSMVLVNNSAAALDVTLKGGPSLPDRYRTYTTSAAGSLAPGGIIAAKDGLRVPARSVVTLVGTLPAS
ncbi:glycoside hydrolase [Chitinophaga japonensis]|uniref:O-glycosyl hydrolase n=1 Tax=Chitinophaga japonensis TaxID=104662 RepID=A0A562T7G0_CHIJA|nr:glycoside hydrolase [Chitinophaga japonensis]TWI88976.1 O-glycosyl hydrolase [Chitinophaga japonensis]